MGAQATNIYSLYRSSNTNCSQNKCFSFIVQKLWLPLHQQNLHYKAQCASLSYKIQNSYSMYSHWFIQATLTQYYEQDTRNTLLVYNHPKRIQDTSLLQYVDGGCRKVWRGSAREHVWTSPLVWHKPPRTAPSQHTASRNVHIIQSR